MLRPVQAARSLSTPRPHRHHTLRPKELIISARAGTPLPEIEAALAEHGQHLIAEPPDLGALLRAPDRPQTIGGIVATNLSGPRRVAWGAMRDHVLGVRFVTGWGEVVHSGGRVLKNVTGLDLCKLLSGSHGTLGVITEVTLKVLPAPEATGTLVLPGLDAAAGVAALSAGLGSPFGVSGAAWLPAERRRWSRNWPHSAARWRCCGSRISPVGRLSHREAARHAWLSIARTILGRRGVARGVARRGRRPPADGGRQRCGMARFGAALGRTGRVARRCADAGVQRLPRLGRRAGVARRPGQRHHPCGGRSRRRAAHGTWTLLRAPEPLRAAVQVVPPEPPPLARHHPPGEGGARSARHPQSRPPLRGAVEPWFRRTHHHPAVHGRVPA